jgi:hypothetical protein
MLPGTNHARDAQFDKILARLKQSSQWDKRARLETDRCVQLAEHILAEASRRHR